MSLEHRVERILCATDFSESADVALAWAASLARSEKAELHLVHAWIVPESLSAAAGAFSMREVAAEVEREIAARLDTLADARGATSRRIRQGIPDAEVAALATELRADLVVVGTHGRTGLSHVLLGSVAERIIRSSPVPVVTVPGGWADRTGAPQLVRRILCPTDLSGSSEAAVAQVIALATRLGAKADLVHVLDMPPYALRLSGEVVAEMERAVRRDLTDLAERHRTEAVGLQTHVRTGVAADAITALATELDCDLIALPTHARQGMARFFLGSVAERVARTAARPVLTLRLGDVKADG